MGHYMEVEMNQDDISQFSASIGGQVTGCDHPGYDEVRSPHNGMIDIRRLLIGLLALACCFAATSAMATNSRDAIRACDANPNCTYHVSDKGVTIIIKDGAGGSTTIDCPAVNGPCQIVFSNSTAPIVGPLAEVADDYAPDDDDIFDMSFVNSGRVESACKQVSGAEFSRSEGTHGCINKACAGPGEVCLIYCVDRQCFGGMPQRPTGGLTLIGILQNGSSIYRGGAAQESDGGGSKSSREEAGPECGIGGCGPIL